MTANTAGRRLVAEALGTMLLVTTVVGSGIMADRLSDDNAVELLGNTLPTGVMLVTLITIFGPISGAHFNPAVSIVMAARGALAWPMVVPYLIAQTTGGIGGSILAHLMFDLSPFQISQTVRAGSGQWIAEAVATFTLVGVILGTLRFRPEFVAVAVGLAITGAYWFTASTAFANPAVSIARAFTDTFAGIAPESLAGFIVAQSIGAAGATVLFGWLFARADPPPAATRT